jgi:hypothetical protein
MFKKRPLRRFFSLLCAASLPLLVMPAARAEAANPSAVLQMGMYVGGIDAIQAAKVGNRVELQGGFKILYDGKTGREIVRVPTGSAGSQPNASVAPFNQVKGDCGVSYLYMRDGKYYNNDFQFSTGFDVVFNVYDFNWRVVFDGPGDYAGSWEDDGPMWPGEYWTSGWRSESIGVDGWVSGEVVTGVVYATNGVVCYTGHPTAAAYAT